MCPCCRLAHIKGDLRLYILPVIDNSIVHMYRVPHDICKKTYRILMKLFCRTDHHISGFFIIGPFFCTDSLSCGTVHNFPPSFNIISGIDSKHIRIQMVHQVYLQSIGNCRVKRCHDIHLLDLFRMCLRPGIILSGSIIGSIYLGPCIFQLCRKFCSVTVTDGICTPLIQHFQCLRNHIQICRDGHSSFCLAHYLYLHCKNPLFFISDIFLRLPASAPISAPYLPPA